MKRRGKPAWIVIVARAWMNSGGYGLTYSAYPRRFKAKPEAISYGFRKVGSGDFNLGELDRGKLLAIWWMDEKVDESREVLAKIAAEIGLPEPSGNEARGKVGGKMMKCPICGKRCEETRDTNREAVAVCDGCGAIWRLETAMEGYYAVRKMLAQAEAERDKARAKLMQVTAELLRVTAELLQREKDAARETCR